tara:strand:+ start:901 stop:1038 length:138 start_codon:yes stop_codon:yes gene_type:complete
MLKILQPGIEPGDFENFLLINQVEIKNVTITSLESGFTNVSHTSV